MASIYENESAILTQSFQYETATHHLNIRWCALGDPRNTPLIFIHGTPWTSRLWVPFALSFSRNFYVYIFDRPGFGESEAERKLDGITNTTGFDDKVWEYDGNLARQAEAFSALFKSWELQWKGKRPHVIAHDNAGLLSLRAYLLHDCHYASLSLIDVVAIGPFGLSLFKAVGEDPSRFERLPDSAIEGILESYIRAAAYHELPKDIMEMLKAPWLKRPQGRKEFLRELCQADNRSTSEVEGLYSQVGKQIPVQIIWGTEDKWLPVKDAWRLGEALGAKEVIIIEKAGHLSFLDQPTRLGIEVATWLNTCEPGK